MPTNRNTFKYHLKRGNKIIHTGITNDLVRRYTEHKQEYGNNFHITQVGKRTTRDAAKAWEDIQRKAGKPTGP